MGRDRIVPISSKVARIKFGERSRVDLRARMRRAPNFYLRHSARANSSLDRSSSDSHRGVRAAVDGEDPITARAIVVIKWNRILSRRGANKWPRNCRKRGECRTADARPIKRVQAQKCTDDDDDDGEGN